MFELIFFTCIFFLGVFFLVQALRDLWRLRRTQRVRSDLFNMTDNIVTGGQENTMIKELTQEQRDMLPVYRDKWLAIGLSTEEVNMEEARKAVADAYREGGLTPPKEIFKFASPQAAIYGTLILKGISHLGEAKSRNVLKKFRKEFDIPDEMSDDDIYAQLLVDGPHLKSVAKL